MTETIITVLVLSIATGSVAIYLLKFKPIKGTKVKDLYAEGLDLMITGRRKAAYKNFKDIIHQDSDNIKAYLRLGQVLREGVNPLQAIKIHRGISHRRNLSHYEKIEMYKNLALDYYKTNNIKAATKELQTLLKIEKNNEWALSQLSVFYRAQQEWKNAGEYLAKYQRLTNKEDKHKLALYKIQEGRNLINGNKFADARRKFEDALNISSGLGVAYYFIGNSYSSESEAAYQKSLNYQIEDESLSDDKLVKMEQAKELLGKAIPMWIRYAELNPKQAWMVIHLLKDGLFALDRYSEFEDILKQILKNDSDNIEVIASLSEMYSHRGEDLEAIELIESALERDPTSLIVKLIKMKLEAKKEDGSIDFARGLDDIIHFLVRDERYQIYKNTATDRDIIWLYETADDEEGTNI
jgi:lipopolysaccharide biosynthesis regulator YciM